MLSDNHYHNSVLLLLYLITEVDGELDFMEVQAIRQIAKRENIPNEFLENFLVEIRNFKEKDVYNMGIEEIDKCTDEEKLKAFSWLFKVSKVDGNVHVKEVRFLLYSVKKAGIDMEDVIATAKNYPPLF